MARITVEDALQKTKNRFALVLLAAKRAKQLLKGSKPLCDIRGNREIVGALREIAAGKVMLAHPEFIDRKKVEAKPLEDEKQIEQ
jgi:DNA-directed RNA polymerase subunit omega